jgi:hypothetical protein
MAARLSTKRAPMACQCHLLFEREVDDAAHPPDETREQPRQTGRGGHVVGETGRWPPHRSSGMLQPRAAHGVEQSVRSEATTIIHKFSLNPATAAPTTAVMTADSRSTAERTRPWRQTRRCTMQSPSAPWDKTPDYDRSPPHSCQHRDATREQDPDDIGHSLTSRRVRRESAVSRHYYHRRPRRRSRRRRPRCTPDVNRLHGRHAWADRHEHADATVVYPACSLATVNTSSVSIAKS